MPRLLLVDDNPSIHRIAESLLAPTDVELTCVDSAAEALDRIGRGERFDVALVDTAMPGMDGWTLLTRLRAMAETAGMPIALMAGVLDPVDPSKLARAPIQGFLKKPIELRELGDRVKALLATPVVVSPSPFSTVPATPARDLVKRAEVALPELRSEPAEDLGGILSADLDLPDSEQDLLLLTAEDLWPEEPAPAVVVAPPPAPAMSSVHLELEELDLDSLQDLTDEPLLPAGPAPTVHSESVFSLEDEVLLPEDEDRLVTLSGLEELETLPSDFEMLPPHPATPVVPTPPAEPDDAFSHLPAAASLIGLAGVAVAGVALHEHKQHEPAHDIQEAASEVHAPAPVVPEPAALVPAAAPASREPIPLLVMEPKSAAPAASGQAAAVPGHAPDPATPVAVSSEQARALVQALLADPVLVDALVRAVVARMGDQVIREIAWEVMPDLAGRLQR
jgi:CheY-like chemotaxis protein